MAKLSILIPIYNVDKYLKQCLESVINQTLKDIEIICLDDGSTDSSSRILDEYARVDSRIQVIHKRNTGYGDTMNIGIQEAKGEYIGIVESDDFVEADMYQELYLIAKKNNLDFIKANYWEFTEDGRVLNESLNQCNCNISFSQYENVNKFKTSRSIWSAIYKRSFLLDNKIKFLPTPGASYQDTSFWFKVYITAKRGYFTPRAYLNYRCDNVNSSVKSKSKVYCVCDELKECKEYLLKLGKSEIDFFAQHYMMVKLGVYEWNIERLSVELKKEFTSKIVEELREDMQNMPLEVNSVLYNNIKYILDNSKEYIFFNSMDIKQFSEIINGVQKYVSVFPNIYIYGAGKKGQALKELFIRKSVDSNIQFVITDNKSVENDTISIYSNELDIKCPIMISIANNVERFKAYMNAKKQGFTEIILVDLTVSELKNM